MVYIIVAFCEHRQVENLSNRLQFCRVIKKNKNGSIFPNILIAEQTRYQFDQQTITVCDVSYFVFSTKKPPRQKWLLFQHH